MAGGVGRACCAWLAGSRTPSASRPPLGLPCALACPWPPRIPGNENWLPTREALATRCIPRSIDPGCQPPPLSLAVSASMPVPHARCHPAGPARHFYGRLTRTSLSARALLRMAFSLFSLPASPICSICHSGRQCIIGNLANCSAVSSSRYSAQIEHGSNVLQRSLLQVVFRVVRKKPT